MTHSLDVLRAIARDERPETDLEMVMRVFELSEADAIAWMNTPNHVAPVTREDIALTERVFCLTHGEALCFIFRVNPTNRSE